MKDRRQFILDTLLPYKEDPTTCGYDGDMKTCLYLTEDGRKCAVGKHMKEGPWQASFEDVDSVFEEFYYDDILTDEAKEQGLSTAVWELMQLYHDGIAKNSAIGILNSRARSLESLTSLKFPELYFN